MKLRNRPSHQAPPPPRLRIHEKSAFSAPSSAEDQVIQALAELLVHDVLRPRARIHINRPRPLRIRGTT